MERSNSSDNGQRLTTALVTGASSGIGREMAHLLAKHGHDLVLVARQARRLEELAGNLRKTYDINVTVVLKDLSSPMAAQEIHAELQNSGIRIDMLINNAGFNVYGPFVDTNLESELQMIQVNVVTLTSLTKLFVRGMVERGFGRILHVASTASFTPAPLDSIYAATKAYVLSFSEAIAEELRGSGVIVTALCPGPTQTEFAERARMTDTKIFRGRLMSAREVASIGYNALLRGERTVVPGLANKALVLSIRFSPRNLVAKIAKKLMTRQTGVMSPGARHV